MRSRILLGPLVLSILLAAGCRKARLTPEQQIRRTISEVEKAVEEKDLKRVGRFVSQSYRDKEQNDRQTAMGMLRLQVMRHPSIHLLVRVAAVDLPGAGRARATVYAAMAALPIAGAAELPQLTADLYRFELELAEEEKEDWRLVGAAWAPARPDDFL